MRASLCRRTGCSRWLFNTRSAKNLLLFSLLLGVFILYLRTSRNVFHFSLEDSNAKKCSDFRPFIGDYATGPTKFPLVMPHVAPKISCQDRNLFITVVVNSACDEHHQVLRMAIRKTWGMSNETQTTHKWRLFFALGMSRNAAIDIQNRRESLKYNDVLIGNFTDNYKNVVIKTFMSHFWVHMRLKCQYILKVDDDVYIRVPKVIDWLAGPAGLPTRFYGGYLHKILTVVRDPRIKWYLPREVYNETNFPPFSQGSFQVVSTDMLPKFIHYTQFTRKPFYTDDAYFGVMARDLGLTARQIPGFRFSLPQTDKDLLYTIAFGHQVDVVGMLKYYARYELLDPSTK